MEDDFLIQAARNIGHLNSIAQAAAKSEDRRSCTCHPDDNPPVPCPRKFALTDCRQSAAAFGLGEIASNLRYWLDWNKLTRDREKLNTDPDTAILAVPPHWPTRGQLQLWAETIETAAALLRGERGAELPNVDTPPRSR